MVVYEYLYVYAGVHGLLLLLSERERSHVPDNSWTNCSRAGYRGPLVRPGLPQLAKEGESKEGWRVGSQLLRLGCRSVAVVSIGWQLFCICCLTPCPRQPPTVNTLNNKTTNQPAWDSDALADRTKKPSLYRDLPTTRLHETCPEPVPCFDHHRATPKANKTTKPTTQPPNHTYPV